MVLTRSMTAAARLQSSQEKNVAQSLANTINPQPSPLKISAYDYDWRSFQLRMQSTEAGRWILEMQQMLDTIKNTTTTDIQEKKDQILMFRKRLSDVNCSYAKIYPETIKSFEKQIMEQWKITIHAWYQANPNWIIVKSKPIRI